MISNKVRFHKLDVLRGVLSLLIVKPNARLSW